MNETKEILDRIWISRGALTDFGHHRLMDGLKIVTSHKIGSILLSGRVHYAGAITPPSDDTMLLRVLGYPGRHGLGAGSRSDPLPS